MLRKKGIVEPNTSLQLFQWMVFQPSQFRNYTNSVKDSYTSGWYFVRVFGYACAISIMIWILVQLTLVGFNIPKEPWISRYYEEAFKVDFWGLSFRQILSLLTPSAIYLLLGLMVCMALGFSLDYLSYRTTHRSLLSLILGLSAGLINGVVAGLITEKWEIGLTIGLVILTLGFMSGAFASGLNNGLAMSLSNAFSNAITICISISLTTGMVYSEVMVCILVLATGLGYGLSFGSVLPPSQGIFIFGVGGVLEGAALMVVAPVSGISFLRKLIPLFVPPNFGMGSYFRIIFYPYRWLQAQGKITFLHNPYRWDGTIWLPIPSLRRKLLQLAKEQPGAAEKFVDFLFEFRPLQRNLASEISHICTPLLWKKRGFTANAIRFPRVNYKAKNLHPSSDWQQQLKELVEQLQVYEGYNNMRMKATSYRDFGIYLKKFQEVNRREAGNWSTQYAPIIKNWLKKARKKAKELEGINIKDNEWRAGEALRFPSDLAIFAERKHAQRQLLQCFNDRIPLILIHGQRRVGKTSLINFLPHFLKEKFVLVAVDLQEGGQLLHLWFGKLYEELRRVRKDPISPGMTLPREPARIWSIIRHELESTLRLTAGKLIVAFDEFDSLLLATHLRRSALQLLRSMLDFSRVHDRFVLIFSGTYDLNDFANTKLSELLRFHNCREINITYLSYDSCINLIATANMERLTFPRQIIDQIFALTKGHPALIQAICKEIISLANEEGIGVVEEEILQQAVEKRIFRSQNGVMDVFWSQYCSTTATKQAVIDIMQGETPQNTYFLQQLISKGYVENDAQKTEGSPYYFRVPLFQSWLTRFATLEEND